MLSIGLMSGTSMDGIDTALIDTDGKAKVVELADYSLPYNTKFKILLKAAEYAVRENAGDLEASKNNYFSALKQYLRKELNIAEVDISSKLAALCLYFYGHENSVISFDEVIQRSTELHAQAVIQLLKKTNYTSKQINVIGYHGQTLFHKPSAKITRQVGAGQLLAKLTEITVINDFRSRDVMAGGQGAPFAPVYHQALAIRDKKIPIAVVNCGGIANITVITGEKENQVIGFDTGPGNGLIDRYIKQRTHGQESMDFNGRYGKRGKFNEEILTVLYQKAITSQQGQNYFEITPPKSLDIGDLQLIPELNTLSLEDACATLEAFTADTIVDSVKFFPNNIPKHWVLAGGGWNNPVIKNELEDRLIANIGKDVEIKTANEIGWNSRALEAQIFAYLAVRRLLNLPISFPSITRVPEPLSGGEIHLP